MITVWIPYQPLEKPARNHILIEHYKLLSLFKFCMWFLYSQQTITIGQGLSFQRHEQQPIQGKWWPRLMHLSPIRQPQSTERSSSIARNIRSTCVSTHEWECGRLFTTWPAPTCLSPCHDDLPVSNTRWIAILPSALRIDDFRSASSSFPSIMSCIWNIWFPKFAMPMAKLPDSSIALKACLPSECVTLWKNGTIFLWIKYDVFCSIPNGIEKCSTEQIYSA